MSADIAPSTKHILSCIPREVVRKMVKKCLPDVVVPWETFEQGSFYEMTYAKMSELTKERASEFFDVINRINSIARFKENGRFIQDEIKSRGLQGQMGADLGCMQEITALSAWVYCNVPDLWSMLEKRCAAMEVASYRTSSFWYGNVSKTMTEEVGKMCFKKEFIKLLEGSQPLKHVHVDADEGLTVTRYVVHFDPYPGKVPMFKDVTEDELSMELGKEAEPFQLVDYREDHKLTIKCKFRHEQTEKIIDLFLTYIIQAKRIPRPQSEYNIAKFNAPTVTWAYDQDPDIINVRHAGIRFAIAHHDGMMEEVGHIRSTGDILEYVNAHYTEDDMPRKQREILEFQVDVAYYQGKRPKAMQADFFEGEIDTRKQKTARAILKQTGRQIKGCRAADKRKIAAFLDHNGLRDLNEVQR